MPQGVGEEGQGWETPCPVIVSGRRECQAQYRENPEPPAKAPKSLRSRERNRARPQRQLGFVVWLDMDGDAHAWDLGLQRLLDAVADDVALAHRHVAVDDEVELDEGGAAGNARLQVVHLERALGIGRDDVADMDMLLPVDRA